MTTLLIIYTLAWLYASFIEPHRQYRRSLNHDH